MNPQIICPYCNAPWTDEMLHQLHFHEGSYTPECVSSQIGEPIQEQAQGIAYTIDLDTGERTAKEITSTIEVRNDIHCPVCKHLIYRKEASKLMDRYDEERWEDFYSH